MHFLHTVIIVHESCHVHRVHDIIILTIVIDYIFGDVCFNVQYLASFVFLMQLAPPQCHESTSGEEPVSVDCLPTGESSNECTRSCSNTPAGPTSP